jgi:hypothetical protein
MSETVVCRDCGDRFELTERTVLEHRRRGIPHLCHDCKHPDTGAGLAAVEAAKQWWLARYPLAELRSWPPV